MQNPVTVRFIECFESLQARKYVRSARQFSLSVEFHPQSFHEILKGRRDVTLELVRKTVRTYPVSCDYLLKGVGSPVLQIESSIDSV
jgi:hypothetical protein